MMKGSSGGTTRGDARPLLKEFIGEQAPLIVRVFALLTMAIHLWNQITPRYLARTVRQRLLKEKFNRTMEFDRSSGISFKITFKEQEYKRRI